MTVEGQPIPPATTTLADVSEDALLRQLLEGISDSVGEEFFRALVKTLAQALGTYCALVTEFDRANRKAKALAFWSTEGWIEGYQYTIAGTPCEAVFEEQEIYHHPDHLEGLFPTDHDIPEMGFVSYLGVPLFDSDGTVLGNLAVLDRKPMPAEPQHIGLLRLFATRAAAEHQRLARESELRERELKLSRLFDGVIDSIVEVDCSLSITQFNRAAQSTFGFSADEIVGRKLHELLEAPDECALRSFFDDLQDRDPSSHSYALPAATSGKCSQGSLLSFSAHAFVNDSKSGRYYTLVLRREEESPDESNAGDSSEQATQLSKSIDRISHGSLLGESPRFVEVLRSIAQVASTDTTVLVSGETGTGKELVARAIHAGSPRRDNKLTCVNCAAIPAELIESEFFGHEQGAFTGATESRVGRFALADGGTLFLDEIGELPLPMQSKLLRVLQEGEFEPVGCSQTQHVDVRVVAATNRNLAEEVQAGRFREDLFYRLNVFPLQLPPLRERGEDILLLADHFARDLGQTMRRDFSGLTSACQERLMGYTWPGNVRELRNVIERALITSSNGRLDLNSALRGGATPAAIREVLGNDQEPSRIFTADEMRDLERRNLLQALKVCQGKVSGEGGAAALLGIKSSTLSSRIKALGIDRSELA